ncbi:MULTISPECIES: VCBS domain-containing protein, partial [Synergistaceae]|uniref:VCBS domain-containing protein n=1 Tax=Synergistaceae TaxID=649777 RepID=UPI003ADBCA5A|nr:VCBS domain-containing protein [Synergistaceae bacterium DZ-S4]
NYYFDELAEGDKLILVYTVKATDISGASDTHDVIITITGTNDVPIANADVNTVYEDGVDDPLHEDYDSNTTIVAGNVLDNDDSIDFGETLTVTGIDKGVHSSVSGKVGSVIDGTYGTLTVNSDGTYKYTLDNTKPAVQGLAKDETVDEVFTYTITDSHGATDSTTLTITVVGTNDAPVINVVNPNDVKGAVTELVDGHVDENNFDHTVNGYFEVTDKDLSDEIKTLTATPQGAGYLGTFTPVIDTQTTGGATGKITWEFKVNDSALDHLAEGETVTQLYDVTVDDGKGGTDTVTVTVTITGSNDAPEIHVRAGDSDAESLTESNIALTATGTLSLSDVDVIDVVNATE